MTDSITKPKKDDPTNPEEGTDGHVGTGSEPEGHVGTGSIPEGHVGTGSIPEGHVGTGSAPEGGAEDPAPAKK